MTNDLRATILTLGGNISKPNEREGAPSPSNKGEGGRDRSASVTQAVVAALQGMIRDGTFKSGAALPPQRELAKQLGVSRASLREAVSILGTLGQLSIEQGRGTFLVSIVDGARSGETVGTWRFATRYSPEEVYQFRLIAESQAVQLAAMNHSEEELVELNQDGENDAADGLGHDLFGFGRLLRGQAQLRLGSQTLNRPARPLVHSSHNASAQHAGCESVSAFLRLRPVKLASVVEVWLTY